MASEQAIVELMWAQQRVVIAAIDTILGWWTGPGSWESQDTDARRQRIRTTLWRLRRAYARVVGDDPSALAAMVADVREIMADLGPAVRVWVECVEALVQEAERANGAAPGNGAQKSAEVKAALIHVLLDANIDVPGVPRVLEPLLLEAVIDATIDGTVQILNSNAAWTAPPPAPRAGVLRRVLRAIGRVLSWPLSVLGAWFEGWTRRRVLARAKLTPGSRALVAHLEAAGLGDPAALARRIADAWTILSRNRRRILGIAELISVGTKEAERIAGMTSVQKKRYVFDLVMIFLEDEGIANPAGVAYPIIESVVDVAIDAVVHVLRKRSVLPRKSTAPAEA